MAAIDPDVDDLLTALLATPLAFCAQAAIDSIVDQSWDDPEDRFFDRERGGFHPERRSRNGQLDMADRVISGRVKREIRMLRRLRELAPELGLTSVGVLPGPAGVRADSPIAELLDPGREDAMSAFLETWNEVRSELRQHWGFPDGG